MVVKQFRASAPVDNLPRITIEHDVEEEIHCALLRLCITYGKKGDPIRDSACATIKHHMWRFHTDGDHYGKACELLLKAGYVGIHVG
jgi:hypothetical protein